MQKLLVASRFWTQIVRVEGKDTDRWDTTTARDDDSLFSLLGGTPRPIEWHAHDPQRYVGDMLAWLHQATPSESENIRALLKSCPDKKQDFGETFFTWGN